MAAYVDLGMSEFLGLSFFICNRGIITVANLQSVAKIKRSSVSNASYYYKDRVLCSFSCIQLMHIKCLVYAEYSVSGKDTGWGGIFTPTSWTAHMKEILRWYGALNLRLKT